MQTRIGDRRFEIRICQLHYLLGERGGNGFALYTCAIEVVPARRLNDLGVRENGFDIASTSSAHEKRAGFV
jgi:hypothetical protein